MNSDIQSALNRLISENPVFVSALGIAPLVMMSHSIITGMYIGIIFFLVLLSTALIISIFRSLIPNISRLAYILILTTTCVSVIDLLTQATFYELNKAVDFYLPLIAMNSLVLFYLENEALKKHTGLAMISVNTVAALVLVICLVTGGLREILSEGGVFLDLHTIYQDAGAGLVLLPEWLRFSLFKTAAGAFVVTGFVFLMIKFLVSDKKTAS